MNKTVRRVLLIAGIAAASCALLWGILTLAGTARRGNVNVYAVSDFSMTDYWGDTSQTSGMVSTDKMQKAYLSETQKVQEIYVEEGQTVKKGDRLLRYDTTLTSLDIERAQIAYEKQKLALETAQKELERLVLAMDQEALQEKIDELTAVIEAKYAESSKGIYDQTTRPIDSIQSVERLEPLAEPAGDGSKEAPLYFNWNSNDELTAENLMKLLPEGRASAYVVLVIHEDNTTLGTIVNCCGLRLEWTKPETPDVPVTPDVPDTPDTPDMPDTPDVPENSGGDAPAAQLLAAEPSAPSATVKAYPARLADAPEIVIDGTTDEIRALQSELDEWMKLLEESFPREELVRMIREKNKEITELDVTIKLAAVNLEKTKKEVGSDTVYSTLDGTVKTVRDPNSTEFEPGQAVVEVSGGGGYYIEGALSELELGTVSVGGTVQVNSWMTGTSCEGEIVEIGDYPTENANSWSDGNNNVSYYPFKVFVPEEAALQEGDWVDMSYQNTSGVDGNALYLESMFIRTENGKSYVMVRGEDSRLEKRWVQTGRSLWGSYTQIRGGLTLEEFVAFPYGRSVAEGAQTVEATVDALYSGM